MEYVILVISVLALFWVFQFVQLMLLSDEDFLGRFDKALWVAVFIFIFPLAPFAFVMYKMTRLSMMDKDDWE